LDKSSLELAEGRRTAAPFHRAVSGNQQRRKMAELLNALGQTNVCHDTAGAASGSSEAHGEAGSLSTAEEYSLQTKQTFRECETCPEMVVVQAGALRWGYHLECGDPETVAALAVLSASGTEAGPWTGLRVARILQPESFTL
jgi:hypothetical protein